MQARGYTLLKALSLAVFCLGSAGAANAAVVNGRGDFAWYGGSSVSVSAAGGPGGVGGILRLELGSNYFFCKVIDLWVAGNEAVVVGQVTRTSVPSIEPYFYLLVRDNAPADDQIRFFSNTNPNLAAVIAADFGTYLNVGPVISQGDFSVRP